MHMLMKSVGQVEQAGCGPNKNLFFGGMFIKFKEGK